MQLIPIGTKQHDWDLSLDSKLRLAGAWVYTLIYFFSAIAAGDPDPHVSGHPGLTWAIGAVSTCWPQLL